MAKTHKPKDYKPKDGVKVFIGIPIGETIYAKTALHLAHAYRTLRCNVTLATHSSVDIIGNRVQLVKMAQEAKATHILMIDHDMSFPPGDVNPIEQLLSHDKDIIGGWYNFRTRGLDAPPVGVPLTETKTDEIFKCQVVGTGFLLVKMSVFDKIAEPWFQFGRRADGTMAWGEDAFFCQKAINNGFDVWADPTLDLKHLGEHAY